ncbi:MAG TPA: N-acetyltransferase [Dehalococcoidales bacterium]|nr:N-acetyltransferase [Dehalococcoidales bacterium]
MSNLEKAKIGDVPQIQQLVNFFADRGEMLARPLSEIYENLRDYFVVREDKKIIGCVALHISWVDLAEIKALAVSENTQRTGLGTQLVKACIEEAKVLEIPMLFCLTYKPAFFNKMGFTEVDKMTLPKKVWTECFHCPKFPDCGETAMILPLKPGYKFS